MSTLAWSAGLPGMAAPSFVAGMVMSLSLIMAIGPQNAHVIRTGLQRRHLWLTVLTCALADIVLIALGVAGLARLGGLSDKLHGALIGAGVLFLLLYGWQAARRCWRPAAAGVPPALATSPSAGDAAAPATRRQAVLAALAFSWLNPHAWLDTAVLIGTASLAWGAQQPLFGLGAATGSVLWFLALGAVAFWLGRRLQSVAVWRALDGLVALMMWGTAAGLIASLFG
ncbi:LysE/ArgO family amino acid transporter [Tepidimonas charontis]|uniref:Arginine exporter protein ArgO n=1 Tax=Tepidimonas charontis TaxID=2267262 RepID=A0A554XIH8_9BURK|nr:LysE family transporter [Tepidimonas charontis]TSE35633.1 Arginine exporter protein ArgO [Tepidimonas charontis]